jgi:hypothetical protein
MSQHSSVTKKQEVKVTGHLQTRREEWTPWSCWSKRWRSGSSMMVCWSFGASAISEGKREEVEVRGKERGSINLEVRRKTNHEPLSVKGDKDDESGNVEV